MSGLQIGWRESAFIPYQPETLAPPGPALVLAPHPDDEVFGCGGAIMKHLRAGYEVSVVIATDSSYGWFEAGEEGQSVRRQESRAAGKVLGYGEPTFWGFGDRELVYDERLITFVLNALAESKAGILYAPSWWEIHPDHYVLALAAVEALRRCPRSIQLMMYEVGVPLHPNYLLDITELANLKKEAMACFESQLKIQRYDVHLVALNRFRTYTLPPNVEYAEAYRLLNGEDLIQNPLQAIRPGIFYAQSGHPSDLAQPLVSILFIGGLGSLADALDSVQLQTYAHIELIVIQDWDWDPSEPNGHLSRWHKGRFPLRVIASDGALTLPERANQAMANALGEWLVLLGDGDSLEPNHIAKLMATTATSELTRCICAGIRLGNRPLESSPEESVWHLAPEPRLPHSYATMPLCAGLFSRSLIQGGCRFDTQLDTEMAIWEFWVQLACKSTWIANSEVTARHWDRETVRLEGKSCSHPGGTSPLRVIDGWLSHCSPAAVTEALWDGMLECDRARGENKALHQKIAAMESALKIMHDIERDLQNTIVAKEAQLISSQEWGLKCESLCQDLRAEVESLMSSTSLTVGHKLKKFFMTFRRAGT